MPLDADETPAIRETEYYRTGQKKRQTLRDKHTARFFSSMDFAKTAFCPLVSEYVCNGKGQLTGQRNPEGVRKLFSYDANGSRASFELFRDNTVMCVILLVFWVPAVVSWLGVTLLGITEPAM